MYKMEDVLDFKSHIDEVQDIDLVTNIIFDMKL